MRVVDRLIAAGLAVRHTHGANRRETPPQLAGEGRRTVEDVTARRRAGIAALVERLTPEERVALVEALTAFKAAGGEPPVPYTRGPAHGPHVLPVEGVGTSWK
ncbi:MarR family winged helix-turn-helix transcriptional regulator [Streptomyces sp. P9-A2]|uniref:MarR family winged helix-turn-helix transcriptional regulator n=1 Tax=Streptomyces sp. P9-A2 TaxID=3072284 RepID=UPI002FC817DC